MSYPQPIPLADQLASLRAVTTAPGWLPYALQALIVACLDRIFDRLEQLIKLWQAGLLPPLPVRVPAPRQFTPATPTPRAPSGTRQDSVRRPRIPTAPAAQYAIPLAAHPRTRLPPAHPSPETARPSLAIAADAPMRRCARARPRQTNSIFKTARFDSHRRAPLSLHLRNFLLR